MTVNDLKAIRFLIEEQIRATSSFTELRPDGGVVSAQIQAAQEQVALWEARREWLNQEIIRIKRAPEREERRISNRMFRTLLRRRLNLAKARPGDFLPSCESMIPDFLEFIESIEKLMRRKAGS